MALLFPSTHLLRTNHPKSEERKDTPATTLCGGARQWRRAAGVGQRAAGGGARRVARGPRLEAARGGQRRGARCPTVAARAARAAAAAQGGGAAVGGQREQQSRRPAGAAVAAARPSSGIKNPTAMMDNQISSFGGQGSQEQTYYCAPDQCTYQLQSSMDHLGCAQSDPVNYVLGAQVYREDVEVVAAPATRKGKERKVSRRGSGFTKAEDEVLCSAFLNVSKDPITGVNQSQGGYYKRLHDYYNTFKPEGSNRSQLAVQHRWGTIQRAVNKFCGFKSTVDRRLESGKNEQDRIDDAVTMYEVVEPFQFMHCWKMLRNEPKWNDKVLELNSNSGGTGIQGSSQGNSVPTALAEEGNANDAVRRPEGRDTAKRKRATEDCSSSSAVQVLQRIQDNREKCQEKEDEQMLQIISRKDEKLSLQRELLNLKKQQSEENFILRKQEADNVAKQAEAQLLSAEAAIMGVDTDKVAPHLKNYYIGMQRQIMERRGYA
ncbi:hypothetical protein ACP4OV_002123 [Aristida adscensionis]